jgi:hypothetical protein
VREVLPENPSPPSTEDINSARSVLNGDLKLVLSISISIASAIIKSLRLKFALLFLAALIFSDMSRRRQRSARQTSARQTSARQTSERQTRRSPPNSEAAASQSSNRANSELDDLFNVIDELPVYHENGLDDDKRFRCVKPVKRSDATIKDRIKSCARVGKNHPDLNERFDNRQTCVEYCTL